MTSEVAEIGENFSAGSPLVSMVDTSDMWFTFNPREDLSRGLKAGNEFDATVPALVSGKIRPRVTVIDAEGRYATWRATRAAGDFDLKTFEARAPRSERRSPGFASPFAPRAVGPTTRPRRRSPRFPVDTHPLFNPTLNYVHFLLATVLPVMPQLTVVTVTAYSVGDDVETAARTRVSTGPGGGLGAFLFAKTMPYTFLFLSMPGLSDIVVFGVLGTPLRGDLLTSATAAILSTARRKLRPRAG